MPNGSENPGLRLRTVNVTVTFLSVDTELPPVVLVAASAFVISTSAAVRWYRGFIIRVTAGQVGSGVGLRVGLNNDSEY